MARGRDIDLDDTAFGALMAAAQAGDQAAYRDILRASVPFIRSIARRSGVPAESTDDAVQEVLLAVHRMLATFDPKRSYSAWLAAIARRRSIDLLRSRGRRVRREVHDPIGYENHPDAADPAASLDSHSEDQRLGQLVSTLPDGQRQAVQILAYSGHSLEEGAELTGRSKTALKVNFHRAIRNLRSRLAGSG